MKKDINNTLVENKDWEQPYNNLLLKLENEKKELIANQYKISLKLEENKREIEAAKQKRDIAIKKIENIRLKKKEEIDEKYKDNKLVKGAAILLSLGMWALGDDTELASQLGGQFREKKERYNSEISTINYEAEIEEQKINEKYEKENKEYIEYEKQYSQHQEKIDKLNYFFKNFNKNKYRKMVKIGTCIDNILSSTEYPSLNSIKNIYEELKKIELKLTGISFDSETVDEEIDLNYFMEEINNLEFDLRYDETIFEDIGIKPKYYNHNSQNFDFKSITNNFHVEKSNLYGIELEKIHFPEIKKIEKFIDAFGQKSTGRILKKRVEKHQSLFIKNKLKEFKKIFDNIDGKSLDLQQRTAVVTDEENTLVIAGAGSGKTLTIAAKVKYLVSCLGVNPEDILLITFTKKAAQEMETRVNEKLRLNIDVKTFHSLGYSLIGHFKNEKPDVFSEEEKFIHDFKNEYVFKNNIIREKIIKYYSTCMYEYISPTLFSDIEFYQYHNASLYLDSLRHKLLKISDTDIFGQKIKNLLNKFEKPNNNIKEVYEELKKFLEKLKIKIRTGEITLISMEELENIIEQVNLNKTLTDMQETLNNVLEKLYKEKKTFNYECVKSVEELIICNYLFINGIKYEYESKYPYKTADKYHREYKPDFYLPDYDFYIEHFGIDENNKCPQFDSEDEKKYIESIEWKRKLHKEKNTTMEETYSYYHKQGKLITELKQILDKHNVKFRPLEQDEIIEILLKLKNDAEYSQIFKLLLNFLSLFKANNYELKDLKNMQNKAKFISNKYQRKKHTLFLEIFEIFYIEYNKILEKNKQIDFNDMINQATEYIKSSNIPKEFQYKYIIIDEFQDISMSRYKLIKQLKEKNNSKIMAVGDDWQSIYRFAGSEISIFTKFTQYFGVTKKLMIEKTYRNSQQLINVASKFIMENPNQISKNLKSNKSLRKPIKIVYYGAPNNNALNTKNNTKYNKSMVNKLVKILKSINDGKEKDILLLGRNNSDVDNIIDNIFFVANKQEKEVVIKSKLFPKFNISFLSVHKSKGIEADEVVILNNENTLLGFPNLIMEDTILRYVIHEPEDYIFSEERRLFYVALTRTKNHCYLLAPLEHSCFIEELLSDINENDYSKYITVSRKLAPKEVKCPECGQGVLMLRQTRDGHKFYGCSNFPKCRFTINSLAETKNIVRCPICGGIMVKRTGIYGEFYGCKNFSSGCRYTLNIEAYESRLKNK